MILTADLDSLKRMLGCEREEDIPSRVVVEYQVRLRMFHADGNSGPLGSIGLIDMCRALRAGPKPPPKQPRVTDWTKMPSDGSLTVEARPAGENGEWKAGVYLGRVKAGTLAIRFAGDPWVHEFVASEVRIPEPEVIDDPAQHQRGHPPNLSYQKGLKPSSMNMGDPIWIRIGQDIVDGVYRGRDRDTIFAVVDGEDEVRGFHREHVVYAGDAPQLPEPKSPTKPEPPPSVAPAEAACEKPATASTEE